MVLTKKTKLSIILLSLLALVLTTTLTACGDKNSIKINTAFKTTYYLNEELDVTGGILDYTVDSKTTQVAITESMISGFSTETVGTRNLVITYEGCSLTVSYTVKEAPISPSFVGYYKTTTTVDVQNRYFFIRFISSTQLAIDYDNQISSNPADSIQCEITNTEILDGKWVFTSKLVMEMEQVNVDLKITVLSKESLKLEMYSNNLKIEEFSLEWFEL